MRVRNEKQSDSCDILYEISAAWKRKDEVNITRLQRSSSFASRIFLFISASLFYRSRATSQERSSCAITFMHLQLWHWWWSAFQLYWAHLLFILQLTIIINCRLCTRLLTEYVLSLWCLLNLILTSYYISFHIICKTIFVLLQILLQLF